jgi:sigma-B regulation protein RsbU (phosphoserine phosphatase)
MSKKVGGTGQRSPSDDLDRGLTVSNGGEGPGGRRWPEEDARRPGRLAGQPLFRDVPSNVLEALIAYSEFRQVAAGDVLLSPGEDNHFLYLLLDGRLGIYIDGRDGDAAFTVEPGEYVGEISMIDGRPATAYVVAAEPCTLLAVPESHFWGDFIAVPEIARNFLRLYAERFRTRNEMIRIALEQRLRFEQIEKELEIAHEIQAAMLPHKLDLYPEVDIVAKMVPARQVGGDFYDLFSISDAEFCVAIGDVSGKGVPAALFMVRAMTLLRIEMRKGQSLERALQQVNVALRQGNEQCMFVTLIVAVVNPGSGTLRYAVAGHNPMIYGDNWGNYRPLRPPAGILAGVDRHAIYEVASLSLAKGDILVLYTDGVTEAMNEAHELFSVDRLLSCLAGTTGLSAMQVSERIDAAVAAFVQGYPPSDDLTTVILRYRGH